MELIYLWINKTQNNFINKSEICFNKAYKITFDSKIKNLKIDVNDSIYNIFENNVISNVTAIVGKNGSGKTTLLNYIYDTDVIPKRSEEREEYIISHKQREEIDETLQIFRFKENNKWKIEIYHNFNDNIELTTKNDAVVINVNDKDYNFGEILQDRQGLFSITKVYLTNSSYYKNQGFSLEYGNTNKVSLNISTIDVLSKDFYRKIVGFPTEGIKDNIFNGLQDMIISTKNHQNLQEICDVIYFNYILRENKIFGMKIQKAFSITNVITPTLLERLPNKEPSTYTSGNDFVVITKKKIEEWRVFFKKSSVSYNNIIDGLYLNLLFELHFLDESIGSKLSTLKSINDVKEYIDKYLGKCNEEYKEYYILAANEIEEFNRIMANVSEIDNIYPKHDLAYIYGKIIDYEKDSDLYLNFTTFITKCAFNERSFILKYIKINGLEMSSGERAYLNFFSWLNSLTFLNHISQEIIQSTNENILLLIDEIELYCHPEWQRIFIKKLLNEIKLQFTGKKIQILFTTHSPITLGDIPHTNVVYLENGKVNEKEIKTFGQNIYNLYKDPFYLESEKGLFFYDIMKDVSRKLDSLIVSAKLGDKVDYSDIKYYNYIISIIGEPVIKATLESKLQKLESEYKSEKLKNIISYYNELSKEEKERLIEHIIKEQEDN
ncbi:AAA family ATPase [Clostridium sp. PL3]|uniref:AAA family ATPase n=1 Tax=Clostridium thailandense TaxID=2794346 RepID=A0A949TEU5_9CLOT|nr:AAA family ATPase [Clostridium thailandense]MBV7271479.1 AAA family ATPase [Clostridium thailandense]